MGYNPDENSDGLIGVGDLQGILTLYGSTFESNDSLNITSDFWDVNAPDIDGQDDYFVGIGTDILYLTTNAYDDNEQLFLPSEVGFKTLLILLDFTIGFSSGGQIEFLSEEGGSVSEVVAIDTSYLNGSHALVFIHGHDNKWYFLGIND